MENKSLIPLAQIYDNLNISSETIFDHDNPSAVTLSETTTLERDAISNSSTTKTNIVSDPPTSERDTACNSLTPKKDMTSDSSTTKTNTMSDSTSERIMTSDSSISERDMVSDFSTAGIKKATSIDNPTQREGVPASTSIDENGSGYYEPPPDGGLSAWVQVLAGWILVMNSRGMTNMFGAFQAYYTDFLLPGISPADISWIGSLQTFILMFVGVMSSRLMDAGYLRSQLCAGIFLEVFGMMMSSLSPKYWQILVFQGLFVGFGAGLLYLPSVIVPSQYFSSQTMLASGIVATGSSMVQYHWAMRCLALIIFATSGISLALLKPRRMTKIVRTSSAKMIMLSDPPYVLFVLAMTFLFASIYIPYFYLEDYGRDQNLRALLVDNVLSITNAASFLGRIFPNWLANDNRIDSLVITSTYCLISGATVLLWLLARGQAWTIIFAIIYGFVSGGLVSLPPATVIALSKTPDEYSTRMGLAFTISSFGVLLGNPIAGTLIGNAQKTGNLFMRPWIFAGGTMILAAVLTMAAFYFHPRATEPIDDNSDLEGRRETRRGPKRLQSLVHEALTMQSTAAFAL